jgi:hypothetical protein
MEIAMAAEKKQAQKQKAQVNQPQTPSKPRVPERPLIGSSSTWRNEQLDTFMVRQGVLEVKEMIPDKWFDFGRLEEYQRGSQPFPNLVNCSAQSTHFTTTGRDKE